MKPILKQIWTEPRADQIKENQTEIEPNWMCPNKNQNLEPNRTSDFTSWSYSSIAWQDAYQVQTTDLKTKILKKTSSWKYC